LKGSLAPKITFKQEMTYGGKHWKALSFKQEITFRGIYNSRPMPSMFENSYSLKFNFDLPLYSGQSNFKNKYLGKTELKRF
jgi:hypothetical protein